MNASGFLPPHPCKACGATLRGDGTGYPAELYAGTYTGLCYPCTLNKTYVVRTLADGAAVVSHPPHCPSWRRDREEYRGYQGCSVCRGLGRVMISRAGSQGGSYATQCKPCGDTFYSHPTRKAYQAALDTHYAARLKEQTRLTKRHDKGEPLEKLRAEFAAWLQSNPLPAIDAGWM